MSDNSPPQIRAAICSPHTPNICCNWCVSSAFHTTDDQAADALGRMWWVIGWFDTPHRQSFSTDVGLFCHAIYISSVIRMARIRTWWWARVRIDLPLCAAHSQLHGRWRRKKRIYCLNQRQTDKTVKLIPFFLFFFECIMFSGDAAQQTGLRIRIIILKVDGIHFEVMANRAGIENDGGDGCTVHWWTEGMCGIIQYPLWNTPICNVLCDNDECVPFVQQYNPYVWCPGVLYSMFMLFKIVLWPNFLSQSEIYCYIPLLFAPLTSRCGDGIDTVRGWMENQASFQ